MSANFHRLLVTDHGVTIPKSWLGSASEVEICEENGSLAIYPVSHSRQGNGITPFSREDPIWQIGKNPVSLGLSDASVNLDGYLSGNPHGLDAQNEPDG